MNEAPPDKTPLPCETYLWEGLTIGSGFKPCKNCGWGNLAHKTDLDSKWTMRADLSMLLADHGIEPFLHPNEEVAFRNYLPVLEKEINSKLASGETPAWFASVESTLEEWADENPDSETPNDS